MTTWKWKNTVMMCTALSLLFPLLALVVSPAPALAGGNGLEMVLYEVVEDAHFFDANGNPTADPNLVVRRIATAQLTGWAKLGTPLCPSALLLVYPKAKRCAVNAVGHDDITIDLFNGTAVGPVTGQFAVVVQGDNPTDAPEAAVGFGSFEGDGDLSSTLVNVPLGSISNGTGEVSFPLLSYNATFTFTGIFRLPFSMAHDGSKGHAWGDRAAFYLKDNGRPLRVRENERSIGWATVRLEIDFQ